MKRKIFQTSAEIKGHLFTRLRIDKFESWNLKLILYDSNIEMNTYIHKIKKSAKIKRNNMNLEKK